jgi:hypothetical protein
VAFLVAVALRASLVLGRAAGSRRFAARAFVVAVGDVLSVASGGIEVFIGHFSFARHVPRHDIDPSVGPHKQVRSTACLYGLL